MWRRTVRHLFVRRNYMDFVQIIYFFVSLFMFKKNIRHKSLSISFFFFKKKCMAEEHPFTAFMMMLGVCYLGVFLFIYLTSFYRHNMILYNKLYNKQIHITHCVWPRLLWTYSLNNKIYALFYVYFLSLGRRTLL